VIEYIKTYRWDIIGVMLLVMASYGLISASLLHLLTAYLFIPPILMSVVLIRYKNKTKEAKNGT